jgi:hypothetical protein
VTFTADNLGDGSIQGPGDLAGVDLEGVFFFNGGDNQNWTISNIRFLDFDLAIGMFFGAGGSDAFNNTHITNNYIRNRARLERDRGAGGCLTEHRHSLFVRHESGDFGEHDRDSGRWHQRWQQFRRRRRHAEQHQRRRGL